MLTKVVTLEYFFSSLLVIRNEPQNYTSLTELIFTNLHNSAQWRHTLAIQSTDMGALQTILHSEIIIQDMWTSCIPLFSADSNA